MMKHNVLIFCIPLIIWSCSENRPVEKDPIPYVKIENVKMYGASEQSVLPGKVKASSEVDLAFRVAGTILKVPVKEGQFVKKGTLLAEIDPRDYKIQLSATEAEYKQIKANADRVVKLYEQNSISQSEYEAAVYGLQQIEAKFSVHKNALADTRLIAPYDGYVQSIYHYANETVAAGYPVVSILNNSTPEVEINLPARDYNNRDNFASFSCTIDNYPDKIYSLVLANIAHKANLNQLYTARLKMSDITSPAPSAGITTMVTITYRPVENQKCCIPINAIFGEGSTSYVWVYDVKKSTIKKQTITLGEVLADGNVIVNDGLTGNEKILVAGIHSVKDGQTVKPLPAKSKTNVGGLL
ncbi:MAG: efflux RND transporter periplasmic adaptor subunit [Bacteroidales bacterium]|nr:efflux RND transporter periplasmic adaptor subunit [Bacteroidales bacterium]